MRSVPFPLGVKTYKAIIYISLKQKNKDQDYPGLYPGAGDGT